MYRVLGGNQQRKRVRLPMRMTMGVGVGPVEMNHAVAALLSWINRMQEFSCLPPVVHRGRVQSRAPQAATAAAGGGRVGFAVEQRWRESCGGAWTPERGSGGAGTKPKADHNRRPLCRPSSGAAPQSRQQ
ncbi:hypothetical protein EDB80DRAFT_674704 [Ilyonectria destructans]|nr:hypothetical protein EDB80DRAFT_674704 [Ilyonectria destructans]